MSYRDASQSLRARRERVAYDLEEARRAARVAQELAEKVKRLEEELAETDDHLASLADARKLPLLKDATIASPCTADWDQMVGDDRVRFCGQCKKNVYNLSLLPRHEAEALLAKDGQLCARLYRRADGTVITSDCPEGLRVLEAEATRRRGRRTAAALGGALLAAVAGTSAMVTSAVQPVAVAPPETAPSATGTGTTGAPVPTATTSGVPFADVMGGLMRDPTQRTRRGRPSCDPPYSKDANGVQHFKPECL